MNKNPMFNRLTSKRNDSEDLILCIEDVVNKLLNNETSSQKPGMLLGKIQSGKTRAFIGIMALAFDNDYNVSIILTKGTKVLVEQTVQRMEKDFSDFIKDDLVEVFDIMHMPDNLTAYERNKKLVIVVKKEVNNMNKILEKLASVYPDLRKKKILIIDDEADFASISFRKFAEAVEVGRISSKIDEIRNIAEQVDYLQVTATPYSLYLQPNTSEESMEFLPKRPAFTTLVPIHDAYVGGDFYFEESEDENSIAYDVFEEVSNEERDVLKQPDARKLKLDQVLISDKIFVLRRAIINFVVGSVVRRLVQKEQSEIVLKYAFVAHSEIGRKSHEWQSQLIKEIVSHLTEIIDKNEALFEKLIIESCEDLFKSASKIKMKWPSQDSIIEQVKISLKEEQLVIVIVNSDKDVEELLDNDGQLKLRNPMNIFVGGQILDRGITINNLIGFYYGRSPKKYQQDTVLQHSRMYGVRPKEDLAVTRFYTTRDIYEVMRRIHEFDVALRNTLEKDGHDKGVYFIRKDVTGKLVPCSPNKILLSSIATLRPFRRMLPVGFDSGYKTNIESSINKVDEVVNGWFKGDKENPVLVDLDDAVKVIEIIEKTLEISESYPWNWNTFKSSLEHLSKNNLDKPNKVWIIVKENMNLSKVKKDGRLSDDPDGGSGKSSRSIAREIAIDVPALILIRQNGMKEIGWRDTPFWWPVLVNPENTEATIFAENTI